MFLLFILGRSFNSNFRTSNG